MSQQFWQLWINEYISTLQQRPKWNKDQLNQLTDAGADWRQNATHVRWKLGHVSKLFPGQDLYTKDPAVWTTIVDMHLSRPCAGN